MDEGFDWLNDEGKYHCRFIEIPSKEGADLTSLSAYIPEEVYSQYLRDEITKFSNQIHKLCMCMTCYSLLMIPGHEDFYKSLTLGRHTMWHLRWSPGLPSTSMFYSSWRSDAVYIVDQSGDVPQITTRNVSAISTATWEDDFTFGRTGF